MTEKKKPVKPTNPAKAKKPKTPEKPRRIVYMNEDGAEFFGDTNELVPGSTWDYPGSPYSSDYDSDD